MSKQVHTVSEEGFSSTTDVRGEFEVDIDATGEDAPDTLESLLAAYAACYIPALRVGGQQRGVEELGRIEIDATGELNDDEKLDAVAFDIRVGADVDDAQGEKIVDRAFDLCKVHDALKSSLHADATIEGDAF